MDINWKTRSIRFLLAVALTLSLLLPAVLAAPGRPSMKLEHINQSSRVLLNATARTQAPDGYGSQRVELTLTIRVDASLTIDTGSIQTTYLSDSGQSFPLDSNHWSADPSNHVVVFGVAVDTDEGGQILCRVSANTPSGGPGGTMRNTAQLDVTYRDRDTGASTTLSASAQDEETFSYSLTLDPNGGSISDKTSQFTWRTDLTAGQQIALADLPQPSRSDYLFDGWTLASGRDAALEPGTLTMGQSDVVLQAKWLSREDHLTLDPNGGSGRTVTVDGIIDEDVTIPVPDTVLYSRDGYKLTGWCTDPAGEGGKRYKGGESFTLTRGEDVLYAYWSPLCTITFDANGGTGQMPRRIFAQGEEIQVAQSAFVRAGYQFDGWSLSADGRGARYRLGDTFTLTGDTTLYAQWEKLYADPPEETDPPVWPWIVGGISATALVGGLVYLLAGWKRRRDEAWDEDGDPDDEENWDDD